MKKAIVLFLAFAVIIGYCAGCSKTNTTTSIAPTQESEIPENAPIEPNSNNDSAISMPVLPVRSETDRVCSVPLKSGDTSVASFTFISDNSFRTSASVEYDIILSKEFLLQSCSNKNSINVLVKLGYVSGTHEDMQQIGKASTAEFTICEDNKKVLLKYGDGQSQPAVENDNCYKFKIRIDSAFRPTNTSETIFLNLTQETTLSAADETGTIHFDNITVNAENGNTISCDFDERFGTRAKQNLMTDTYFSNSAMGYSHGLISYLSEIDSNVIDSNFISVDVVMDGNVASDEYDPNFSSLTVAFRDEFQLADELVVAYDMVIPKTLFEGFSDNSALFPSLDLVIDGSEIESTARCLIKLDEQGKPICCKDGGIYYTVETPKTDTSEITIEEKTDCYIFHITGKLKCDFSSAKEIWLKAKFSGNNCVFAGNWYYNNFQIMDAKRTILSFDVSANSHPANLIELYSPTTNGIKYNHDKIVYGFAFVGFQKLNLDNK